MKSKISSNHVYRVYTSSMFFDVDQTTLTHLYQPIIGVNSVALYSVLLTEANNTRQALIEPSHDRLLKILSLTFDSFLKAKDYLEAVGLLKTYLLPENGKDETIYLIFPPKTPKSFFSNVFLSKKLMQNLGEIEYDRTLFFLTQDLPDFSTGLEITKRFEEVFESGKEDFKQINENNLFVIDRDKVSVDPDSIKEIQKYIDDLNCDYQITTKRQKDFILKTIKNTTVSLPIIAKAISMLVQNNSNVTYQQIIKSLEVYLGLSNFIKETFDDEANSPSTEDKEIFIENETPKFQENSQPINKEWMNKTTEQLCKKIFNRNLNEMDKLYIRKLKPLVSTDVLNCVIFYVSQKQPGNFNWEYTSKIITNSIVKYKLTHDHLGTEHYIIFALGKSNNKWNNQNNNSNKSETSYTLNMIEEVDEN